MDKSTLVISLLKLKDSTKEKVYNFIKSKGFDARKCSNELDSYVSENKFAEYQKVIASTANDLTNGVLNKIYCVSIFDKEFSPFLYNTKSNPCLYLYYKGNLSLLNDKCVTVLGNNNVAQENLDEAYNIGKELARANLVLVTDLSFGCNTETINGALEANGKIIIVFSNDLHSIQPSENKELVEKVLKAGGLIISEYPLGNPYSYSCRSRKYELLSLISSLLIIVRTTDNNEIYSSIKKSLDDKKQVIIGEDNNFELDCLKYNLKDLIAEKILELYEKNIKDIKGEQMTLF